MRGIGAALILRRPAPLTREGRRASQGRCGVSPVRREGSVKVQNSVATAPPRVSAPAGRGRDQATPAERDKVDPVARWVIALFFVALFIPGSFNLGVRMTPFRLYLLVMAVPMALRYRNDPTLRLTPIDALVFLATVWRGLALVANHGTGQLVFAGASFMELFLGYLLGRAYVRNLADHRYFFRCFLGFLIVALPFALIENVTRTRFLGNLAGAAGLQQVVLPMGSPQIRFGLMRVQLSFDHAILFGMFCSLGFANLFYLYRFPRNLLWSGLAGFMGLLAISSSSILTLGMQGCLIVYERMLRPLRNKWIVLALLLALLLGSFQLLFGMSPLEYVAFNLTINVSGALARFDQMHYGMLEIQRHPIFGIGLNTFSRPFWRADVFDNFWLAMAVRYGAPTTIFFALGFVLHALRAAFATGLDEEERRARTGYLIAFSTLLISLGTHSIWGSGMVYVMLYLGMGAWIYDTPRARPARQRIAARPKAESESDAAAVPRAVRRPSASVAGRPLPTGRPSA